MTALAEKLKQAGVDTFAANFHVIAIEALRANPHSVVDAWRYMGEKIGFEYLRNAQKDMQPTKAVPGLRSNFPDAARRPVTTTPAKPYQARVISTETVERRRQQAAVIRSKYKAYDGRSWSEVGWHELPRMARSGSEAADLLSAGPANVPNDGRSVSDVLTIAKIDQIIAANRGMTP